MARTSFHLRFGFAVWLHHLRTGREPKYAQIGAVADRTGVAVAAWYRADEPPPDWKVHEPVAGFLGVDERWLFRDEGEPPEPDLWERWVEARRAAHRRPPSGHVDASHVAPAPPSTEARRRRK